MRITRQTVADKVGAHLRRELSLEELVDWAEQAVMDAEFESDAVRDAVARLGVADVRAFGLTWEDCRGLLNTLGFDADVRIEAA